MCEECLRVKARWDLGEDAVALVHGNKGEADIDEEQRIHLRAVCVCVLSAINISTCAQPSRCSSLSPFLSLYLPSA